MFPPCMLYWFCSLCQIRPPVPARVENPVPIRVDCQALFSTSRPKVACQSPARVAPPSSFCECQRPRQSRPRPRQGRQMSPSPPVLPFPPVVPVPASRPSSPPGSFAVVRRPRQSCPPSSFCECQSRPPFPPAVPTRVRVARHSRQLRVARQAHVGRPVPARVLVLGDKGTQFYYCAPWLNQVWHTRSAWQSRQISKR